MGNQTSRVLSHKKKYECSKSSSNTSNAGSRRGSITDCFIKQNQNLVPVKNEEEIKEKDRYQRMVMNPSVCIHLFIYKCCSIIC